MLRIIVAGAAVAAVTVSAAVGTAAQRADAHSPCQRAEDRVRVVTANIKSVPLMRAEKVKQDMTKVAHSGGDVLMWQEITPDYYKRTLRELKIDDPRRGQWRHFQTELEIPISVRVGGDSPWEVVGDGRELMHGGRAKVSPNRYISWVKLKDTSSGRTTVFMNTHMVSGAWNGKENTDDPWRKDRWNEHRDKQMKKIEAFVKAGHSVVYGGDFNRQDMAKLHPRDERIMPGGIDYVGVVLAPGDNLTQVQGRDVIGLNSDHAAKFVRATVAGCAKTRKKSPAPTKSPQPTKSPAPTRSPEPTRSPSKKSDPAASPEPAPTSSGSTGRPATPRGDNTEQPAPSTEPRPQGGVPKEDEGGLADTGA